MKTFAVKYKDKSIVEESRSGGVFTAISDLFLDEGAVYGCVLNQDFKAVHARAEDSEERNRMRGSKYVQSNMGESYKEVKRDLESGRKILFSGTSCQVAGLQMFLDKEYDNLLCIDIVCHGVPSPKVWEHYLRWQTGKKKILSVDFRNKRKYGWRDHIETIYFDGKQIDSKVWTNIFYSGNALRPSCYECPYKSIIHPGDITIADYWNIERAAPEFDDNRGVSLVLVNTEKGKEYFDKIKGAVIWKETQIEDSMQRAFIKAEAKPKDREQFWIDFNNRDFQFISKKYGGRVPIWHKMASRIKQTFIVL